jgi:bifunctional enzyme CysN/CysC
VSETTGSAGLQACQARNAGLQAFPANADRLRLVVVGHVDHGKSTLIGRLLFDTGSLLDGKYEQLVAIAARRGVPFEFANLTDALQAERDQNITIDTTQIWFRTARRQYVLIDAPGHKEFVKNMVTGAAAADAALVIIDAQEGVQEQSRRHGHLLKLLGVAQIAVAVNKLDRVRYSQETFDRVVAEYRSFLEGVGIIPGAFVPISARHGDNVASLSAETPWYFGGSIVDALDAFVTPVPDVHAPLRLPVQAVYRFDHRRIIAGRVESGSVRVGDRLLFLPSGKQSTVKSIEAWSAPTRASTDVGDSIGITLTEQLFLKRGDVACVAASAPALTTEFSARLFWLGKNPLTTGRAYTFKLTTQEFDGEVVGIAPAIDVATLEPAHPAPSTQHPAPGTQHPAPSLTANCVADITIRTRQPIVLDRFDRVAAMGRFVVVDDLDVCGGGVILDTRHEAALTLPASDNLTRSFSNVPTGARHAKNGHKGAVVWFTGLSGAGKSTLATALERELFLRGRQAFVLDGDNIRLGLNADLGFSDRDRGENLRRVAEMARLFADAGFIAITAFISPFKNDRIRARRILSGRAERTRPAESDAADIPFAEVFLNTPLAVCEARDPKQLYVRARAGEIAGFTGVSAPFEAPDDLHRADLVIDTSAVGVDEAVAALIEYLEPRIAV